MKLNSVSRHVYLGLFFLGLLGSNCSYRLKGQDLLDQGKYDELLRTVRPVTAEAFFLRAQALWRQGKIDAAREAILLGLAKDDHQANGHLLLGFLELETQNEGQAFTSLSRALDLRPSQQCLRRAVAKLLVRRAVYRSHQDVGLMQFTEAKQDLERAIKLDSCLKASTAPILKTIDQASASPSRYEFRLGINPPPRSLCPGPPKLNVNRLLKPGTCDHPPSTKILRKLKQRFLLLGCSAAQAARSLEAHGCLEEAYDIWTALQKEAPTDRRWALEASRNLLARGAVAMAQQRFVNYVFFSKDRAQAWLDIGEMAVVQGYPKLSAHYVAKAIPFAKTIDHFITAITLFRLSGFDEKARQVAALAKSAKFKVPKAVADLRLQKALQAAPRLD